MNNLGSDTAIPVTGQLPTGLVTLFHSDDDTDVICDPRLEKIHSNPAIYFVGNFLSAAEIDYFDDRISQLERKFQATVAVAEFGNSQLSESDSSSSTILHKSEDSILRHIENEAAGLVGLDVGCVEPLQIVSYLPGQSTELHHDAVQNIPGMGNVPKRLVTLMLFLNDLPESQGSTMFTSLNLGVTPEKGCGILFCNYLPNGELDERTVHKDCTVAAGLFKYGVNIRMSDSSANYPACEVMAENAQSTDTSQIPRHRSKVHVADTLTALYTLGLQCLPFPTVSDSTVAHRNWAIVEHKRFPVASFLSPSSKIKKELSNMNDTNQDGQKEIDINISREREKSETTEREGGGEGVFNSGEIRLMIVPEAMRGFVTRISNAESPTTSDNIYEIQLERGDTIYYDEDSYVAASALYERIFGISRIQGLESVLVPVDQNMDIVIEQENKKRNLEEAFLENPSLEYSGIKETENTEIGADEEEMKMQSKRMKSQDDGISVYCVPVNTVLKWRGKKGAELEYLLGCGLSSSDTEQARMIEVLNTCGKLICILCNQTISATKKSLQKHQLTKRHTMLHNDVISGIRAPPTSEPALKMEVPLPLPNTPHFSKPTQSALPSISRQNATSSPLDASMSHHLISNQIPYKTRPFNHSLSVSTDKKYVQDSSIMATSMSEVKGWRNRRCIHIDFVLGCREGSDAAEETRAEFILRNSLKLVCVLCNQTVAANRKSLRRHQRESKRHGALAAEIDSGVRGLPDASFAMTISIPTALRSNSLSFPSDRQEINRDDSGGGDLGGNDEEGDRGEDGDAGVHDDTTPQLPTSTPPLHSSTSSSTHIPTSPSYPTSSSSPARMMTSPTIQSPCTNMRPSTAASAFSVNMSTVLAWRGKNGLDVEYLLGCGESSTVLERQKAHTVLVKCGKLICILCNQSLAGNRKSVYKHMLTKKHSVQANSVHVGMQPFPSTVFAMGMDVPLPCLLTNPTRTTHTGSESVEKFENVDSLVMHENDSEGGDENNDENDNENENDNEESGDMTNGYRIGGDIISDSINSSNVLMGDGDYDKYQSLTRIQHNNNTIDYQTTNGGISNGNGNDNVINVNEFRVLESNNMGHSVVQTLQREGEGEGEEETKKEERKDHVTDQMQQEREIFGQNDIVYDVQGNATSTSNSSASLSAIDDRGGVHFNSLTGTGLIESGTAAVRTYGVGGDILGMSSASMDELCGDIMAAQNEVQVEFENAVAMRCENEVVSEVELGCEEGKDGGVVTGEVEKMSAGEITPMGVKNDQKIEDIKEKSFEEEEDGDDDDGEEDEDEEGDDEGGGCVTACL